MKLLEDKTGGKHLKKRVFTLLLLILLTAALAVAPLMAAWGAAPAAVGPGLLQQGSAAAPALPRENGGGPTFGGFVGSNSFFSENQSTYEIFGNIREYHPLCWTEWTANDQPDAQGIISNTITSMNPQATFMNTWGVFDYYYKTMYDRGIEVTMCLTGGASHADQRAFYQSQTGQINDVPASYLGHAQSIFQHVARYGSNKGLNPALVRVAAGTEKKIGLGYVRY